MSEESKESESFKSLLHARTQEFVEEVCSEEWWYIGPPLPLLHAQAPTPHTHSHTYTHMREHRCCPPTLVE